ncbi:expressed unknown protein [Seminavis robusta]|uniref:Uncharacterized protein n=1 Tax=Seminavis robusta TaxID=568900 RepID=A0A9N8DMC1_9STRA|nr:expressed unknown protein [Seminavis robusta]|eukprot:Sro238_g095540.1 n/a (159) ;mRNA; f:34151-34627
MIKPWSSGVLATLLLSVTSSSDAFVVPHQGRDVGVSVGMTSLFDFCNEPLGGKDSDARLDEQWRNNQDIMESRRRRQFFHDGSTLELNGSYSVLGTTQLPEVLSSYTMPPPDMIPPPEHFYRGYHPGEQYSPAFSFQHDHVSANMNNRVMAGDPQRYW